MRFPKEKFFCVHYCSIQIALNIEIIDNLLKERIEMYLFNECSLVLIYLIFKLSSILLIMIDFKEELKLGETFCIFILIIIVFDNI